VKEAVKANYMGQLFKFVVPQIWQGLTCKESRELEGLLKNLNKSQVRNVI
jgi:hypothetical protein